MPKNMIHTILACILFQLVIINTSDIDLVEIGFSNPCTLPPPPPRLPLSTILPLTLNQINETRKFMEKIELKEFEEKNSTSVENLLNENLVYKAAFVNLQKLMKEYEIIEQESATKILEAELVIFEAEEELKILEKELEDLDHQLFFSQKDLEAALIYEKTREEERRMLNSIIKENSEVNLIDKKSTIKTQAMVETSEANAISEIGIRTVMFNLNDDKNTVKLTKKNINDMAISLAKEKDIAIQQVKDTSKNLDDARRIVLVGLKTKYFKMGVELEKAVTIIKKSLTKDNSFVSDILKKLEKIENVKKNADGNVDVMKFHILQEMLDLESIEKNYDVLEDKMKEYIEFLLELINKNKGYEHLSVFQNHWLQFFILKMQNVHKDLMKNQLLQQQTNINEETKSDEFKKGQEAVKKMEKAQEEKEIADEKLKNIDESLKEIANMKFSIEYEDIVKKYKAIATRKLNIKKNIKMIAKRKKTGNKKSNVKKLRAESRKLRSVIRKQKTIELEAVEEELIIIAKQKKVLESENLAIIEKKNTTKKKINNVQNKLEEAIKKIKRSKNQ